MSDAFDRALRDLSRVIEELSEAAPDDFATRSTLMQKRDQLRDKVARLRGDDSSEAGRSTEDLHRELSSLEKAAEELRELKIDAVKQAGGGSRTGEMGTLGVMGINARISEASSLTAIEQRIQRLRSIIEDRKPV